LVRNFGQSTAPDDWGLQAMHSILGLFDRFRRDERGAFAVVFAVIAIVLVAMSGAVVDFTSMQQSRTRAQVALDADALALQPRIYDTAAGTIHDEAQNLLINRLADQATTWKDCAGAPAPCVSVGTPTLDTVHGQLTLTATLKVPMNFVSLVGVPTLTAQLVSVATRKKLNLEVAMTLDNSGSMAYAMGYNKVVSGLPTRMDVLKDAATCATNILFYGTASCSASTTGLSVNPNVKMGLVPFTEAVNVGTANASATWIDRAGNGSWNSTNGGTNITDDNFDNDDYDNNPNNTASLDTSTLVDSFTGPVDRIALFSQMKDINGNRMAWGGCVEARQAPYDTDDTVPDSTVTGTLFTPYFAPDEPDSGSFSNNYISDKGVGTVQDRTESGVDADQDQMRHQGDEQFFVRQIVQRHDDEHLLPDRSQRHGNHRQFPARQHLQQPATLQLRFRRLFGGLDQRHLHQHARQHLHLRLFAARIPGAAVQVQRRDADRQGRGGQRVRAKRGLPGGPDPAAHQCPGDPDHRHQRHAAGGRHEHHGRRRMGLSRAVADRSVPRHPL